MRVPKQLGLLFVLGIFFAGITATWLFLEHGPAKWDDAWYLTNSLEMLDALAEGGLPAYTAKYFTLLRTKAPLITVLPTPIYLVVGRHPRAACLVNLVAMFLLFAALYAIARRFRGSRTGLIAVFVAGTMPLLYGLSRYFLVEYSLTAIVCLTIYLVIEALENQGIWLFFLLGITCGLGALLKISFPLYVFLPVLYLLIHVWHHSERARTSFAALLAPFLLLALPWYLVNYKEAIERAVFSASETAYGTGPAFSLPAINLYLLNVVNFAASGWWVLLAGALFLFLLFTGKIRGWFLAWPKSDRVVLILWALPFFVFLFGRNKDLRYIAPIMPALALIIASALDYTLTLRGGWMQSVAAVALLFPLVALLNTSFGLMGDLNLSIGDVVLTAPTLYYAPVYDPQGWPQRRILEQIVRTGRIAPGERPIVMIGSDLPEFNGNNFELPAVRYRIPLQITTSAYDYDQTSLLTRLQSVSFVVYEDGGEQKASPYNPHQKELVQEVQGGGRFREISSGLRLPDGGLARIFENTAVGGKLEEAVFERAGSDQLSAVHFDFGGQISLTGLAFERAPKSLEVRLRWQCLKAPNREYRSFIHILDEDGNTVGQLDHFLTNGSPPVVTWRPGDVALESMRFPLAAGQQGGTYHLRLGLFDLPTGERLPVKIVSAEEGFSVTDSETALLTPEAVRLKP